MDNNLYIFITTNTDLSFNFMFPNFINEVSNPNNRFFRKVDYEITSLKNVKFIDIVLKFDSNEYKTSISYKSFESITSFIDDLFKSEITKPLPSITLKIFPLTKNKENEFYFFSSHSDYNFQFKTLLSSFDTNTEIKSEITKYIDKLFEVFLDDISYATLFKVEIIHEHNIISHTYSSDIEISNQQGIINDILSWAFYLKKQITNP